jgi:hypothetical protein
MGLKVYPPLAGWEAKPNAITKTRKEENTKEEGVVI